MHAWIGIPHMEVHTDWQGVVGGCLNSERDSQMSVFAIWIGFARIIQWAFLVRWLCCTLCVGRVAGSRAVTEAHTYIHTSSVYER